MELRQIQHFVAVADAGNFTRAAAQVHIVQSGLSASVQALERELGTTLFRRTGRSVELTDAGVAFLPEARKVLVAVDAARDVVCEVHGGVRGTVRVGIWNSLALPELAGVLYEFGQERPEVNVVAQSDPGGSVEFVRSLLHDQLDVAFTALPLDQYPDGLSLTPLTTIKLMLALPAGHPLTGLSTVSVKELDGETFVDYPAGWGIRQEIDALFAREGITRRSVIEVADIPTVLDLVVRGHGMAFVLPTTATSVDGLEMVHVEPCPQLHVSLAVRAEMPPRSATTAFIEAVNRHFI